MASRAAALKKIERLYGLIETMHAVALQEAAALVHEAEAAIDAQRSAMRDAVTDTHQALSQGDRERYAVAQTQRDVSGSRQQSLELVRVEREIATEAAREEYGASRIRRGQIKAVVDTSVAAEQLMAGRRAQSVSDDRYLSRLRWNRSQDEAV